MESRVCGGCGSSSFMTLMTTNEVGERLDRLAYLQTIRDVPPVPDGSAPGSVELKFYELWNEPLWTELFGEEPTLEAIAKTPNIRLAKVIKSPSGIMRARIYELGSADFEPVGDERCEDFPSLHKSFRVDVESTRLD